MKQFLAKQADISHTDSQEASMVYCSFKDKLLAVMGVLPAACCVKVPAGTMVLFYM
jgi:hypothetical protein